MGLVFTDHSITPYQNGRFDKVNSTITHAVGSFGVVYAVAITYYTEADKSASTEKEFEYTTDSDDSATNIANSLAVQINTYFNSTHTIYKVIASVSSNILITEQTSETVHPYGFTVASSEDHTSLSVYTDVDYVTAIADDAGKVHFHSETNQAFTTKVMDLTDDQAAGTYYPVFYSADGQVRVSDAKIQDNTRPKGLYYLDYGATGNLTDSMPGGTSTPGWEVHDAYTPNAGGHAFSLKDADGDLDNGNDNHAENDAGNGQTMLNWWEDTQGNSTWGTEEWPIHYSLVYDGNQISIPKRVLKNSTPAYENLVMAEGKAPIFEVSWASGATGTGNYRVTGFQWFLRYKGQLYFFLEADRNKGIRLANKTQFIDWTVGTSGLASWNWARTDEALLNPILVETFDIMNGYSWRLPTNGFDTEGTGFRTACVANRRSWVGNVKIKDREGTLQVLPDAVIKSPVNQFDVHPYDNMIEPVVNDGSEVTALYEHSDRLLMFKTIDLYIINIGGAIEYMEQKIAFGGIHRPQQACSTPYGICWVNPRGIYMFNGKQTVKLNEKGGRNSLSEDQLQTYSGTYSAIGYDFKLNKLFIRPGYTGGTSALIYDFTTESFAREDGAFIGTHITNFAKNREGRMIWGQHTYTSSVVKNNIDMLGDQPVGQWGTINTGYLDFGDPAQFKQFMSVYVTYTTGDNDEPSSYTNDIYGGSTVSSLRIHLENEKGAELELKARNSKETLVDNIVDDGIGRAVLKYTGTMQTAGMRLKAKGLRNFRAIKIILTGYFPSDFELEDMTITFKPKKPR